MPWADPYLIGFYDQKTMPLSHGLDEKVTYVVEVDPSGQGPWIKFMEIEVLPGGDSGSYIP